MVRKMAELESATGLRRARIAGELASKLGGTRKD